MFPTFDRTQYYNSPLKSNLNQEDDRSSSCSQLENDYVRNMIFTGISSGLVGFLLGSLLLRLIVSIKKRESLPEWIGYQAGRGKQKSKEWLRRQAERVEEIKSANRIAAAAKLRKMADRIEDGQVSSQTVESLSNFLE
jgi:hypothetical protein